MEPLLYLHPILLAFLFLMIIFLVSIVIAAIYAEVDSTGYIPDIYIEDRDVEDTLKERNDN